MSNATLGSLFDGIGGFPYAGQLCGITPLWASEIVPEAIEVTKRHFPVMSHLGDITRLNGAELSPVDVVTFGSPCQDLSVAGKRLGLKDGERSGLFAEAIRIIDEMREATNNEYPKCAVWENVPGAFSSGKPKGADFAAVLSAFTKTEVPIPESGRWANAGLVRGDGVSVAWRVLNAAGWGVPQRRKRIFLVADFTGGCAGEILFIEKGLRGDSTQGYGAGQRAADVTTTGVESSHRNLKARCAVPINTQVGLRNHKDGDGTGFGVAEDGAFAYTLQAGHQHAVCTDLGQENCLTPWDVQDKRIYSETGQAPTMSGADLGGGRNPAGCVLAAGLNGHKSVSGSIQYAGGTSPTLEANMPANVLCLATGQADAEITDNITPTLTCAHEQPIAAFMAGQGAKAGGIAYSESVAPTLKGAPSGTNMSPVVVYPEQARTLTARADSSPCVDRGQNIVAYGVCSAHSGAMMSDNPNTGFYEADSARTLDRNGCNPCCNQGGMLVAGVCQNASGEVRISETAYTLATNGNAREWPNQLLTNNPTPRTAIPVSYGVAYRRFWQRRSGYRHQQIRESRLEAFRVFGGNNGFAFAESGYSGAGRRLRPLR